VSKQKVLEAGFFRREYYSPSEIDSLLIDPQFPFEEISYVKVGCYYEVEYFDDIDNLIHYGGQTVDDFAVNEIKHCLKCDDEHKVFFSEEQIKAYHFGKFSKTSYNFQNK
jgi:hypothetical protein